LLTQPVYAITLGLVEDDVGSLYEERIGVMKRKIDRVNNP
jgi:hypothetical protein